MPRLARLVLSLTAVLFLQSPALAETELEQGQRLFSKHCKVCHGEQGDGLTFAANALSPPPRNFLTETSRKELTRQRILESIQNGRKGTAMMPWKSVLTETEIQALASYIRIRLMEMKE
ncbi:MAG: cytochrome c [Candidatus Nitrohelix vancouverensis]|uniref:Cytochrome c n=1 Tax=Candidatus Nitrohelix vancouverensis TaxID=2705534 RepID=A0A7T0C1V2_9BACT|nr:MAG: cytochrome c [Candidatus Nitrohelix vancouverensis]